MLLISTFPFRLGKRSSIRSLKIFTMDKSLDRVFDEEVRQFLLKNEIAFEEQI